MEASFWGGKNLPADLKKVSELTKRLVNVYSPSGQENELAELLAPLLRENFKVSLQRIGSRNNVIATKGKPDIILSAHMDTVPGKLKTYEDNKFIYGRGACDAKGAIASMILAAEKAAAYGASDFGLLFDVGEENSFEGVLKAVNIINPKLVVLGEPSSGRLVTQQKGLLQLSLTKKGKAAPAATPYKGISAIELLIASLNRLISIETFREYKKLGNTINIGMIEGGKAANIVADESRAIIDIRTVSNNSKILKDISKVLGRGVVKDLDFEPCVSDAKYLSDILKVKTITMPYFTEMYFWNKKSKAVVLGPGDYSVAHTEREKVSKRELLTVEEKYLKILTDDRVRRDMND